MKVFITRELPEIAFKILKKNKIPFDYFKEDKPIPRKTLLHHIRNCEGLISLLTDKIDREVIDKMPKCKIIANYAVGFNNIDVAYAKKKKIIVTNTPGVLTESTADLTMALVLACARRISEGERFLKDGKFTGWKPKLLLGMELKGKNFGILGAGRIGCAVAGRAKSFGMNIIYFDNKRNGELDKKLYAKKLPLKSLLQRADIISVHLPLSQKTFHLLNNERFKYAKEGSILINTSRGEIIDERALVSQLRKNHFKAVGLDVFENEPKVNSVLIKYSNVIVLPHLGSATNEARNAMAELAVRNVINVLRGKPPLTPVF
jgi:glyoxylate reductase